MCQECYPLDHITRRDFYYLYITHKPKCWQIYLQLWVRCCASVCSTVGIETRLWAAQLILCVSTLAATKVGILFKSFKQALGTTKPRIQCATGNLPPRDTAVGAWSKPLHLVPRLSIRGDVTLFPHTSLCCAHWQLDSYLGLNAKLWSKMRKCFFCY